MLDTLRALSLVVWLACFVALFGSATRYQLGRAHGRDQIWALAWLISALLTAWGVRNVAIGPTLQGQSATITSGLHVLTIMVGCALLWRRYQFEGWRW